MSPFWQNLELLPSSVRQKAREKPPRSPEEYEESREKVKEGIREGQKYKEKEKGVAEVMLYIEANEEELKEKMRQEKLEGVLAEIQRYDLKQWRGLQQAFAAGSFDISVEPGAEGHPQIRMQIELPEGAITEKLELHPQLQQALITKALGKFPLDGSVGGPELKKRAA